MLYEEPEVDFGFLVRQSRGQVISSEGVYLALNTSGQRVLRIRIPIDRWGLPFLDPKLDVDPRKLCGEFAFRKGDIILSIHNQAYVLTNV
jgi:hypothetical protein